MEYPNLKLCIDTSEDDIVKDLYTPCLCWANRFDRGVGYFTSGWLSNNIVGLSDFASRGGKIRLLTSPILSEEDSDAIINAEIADHTIYQKFVDALMSNVDDLQKEMAADIFNAFSWMIHDEIIDIKFVIPHNKLENGVFHTKFGIFYNGDDAVSFNGSINDSAQGLQNFEDISVFATWKGTKDYVNASIKRFERIWNKNDTNLRVYDIPNAIQDKIFSLRTKDRPYQLPKKEKNKWGHQDKAVDCFIKKEHGILAMATGTGKTVTAMKIINRLFEEGKIRRVVITMFGNDLLDQWAKQMRENYKNKQIYYHYESHKMINNFIIHPDNSILLISRDADNLSKLLTLFNKAPGDYKNDTLFIFDEVHGAGSDSFVKNLSGCISPYRYRLGLSATPEREYDEAGNKFLQEEIGDIIFTFSLEDAIEKGILCEFDYIPLPYVLSEEEKAKKKKIIAAFNAKKEAGEPVDEKDMFTQLSRINKIAINKINEFESFISANTNLLEKSIIFVQEMEYGIRLQDVLMKYTEKYHTYYADDDKSKLDDFANGNIDCLLTCKKISEGIDISSVTNIFLFASDRSKLVTTQRIGRALRLDKNNPAKKAKVIDFILDEGLETDNNADQERKEWLIELSKARRKEYEE